MRPALIAASEPCLPSRMTPSRVTRKLWPESIQPRPKWLCCNARAYAIPDCLGSDPGGACPSVPWSITRTGRPTRTIFCFGGAAPQSAQLMIWKSLMVIPFVSNLFGECQDAARLFFLPRRGRAGACRASCGHDDHGEGGAARGAVEGVSGRARHRRRRAAGRLPPAEPETGLATAPAAPADLVPPAARARARDARGGEAAPLLRGAGGARSRRREPRR